MTKLPLLVALAALSAAANAVTIYDSIFTTSAQTAAKTLTTTSSTPRSMLGGVFALNENAGAFDVDTLLIPLGNFGTTTVTDATVNVRIFDTLGDALFDGTTGPAFSNPILDLTATFSGFSTAAGSLFLGAIDLSGLTLDDQTVYGISISTGSNTFAPLVSYGPANYVGDDLGYDGFLRDANGDGTLQGSEQFAFGGVTNQGLAFAIEGTPQAVPEPASLAALGLGAAAFLRRRKRA